jgi:tape measure domain-containing protein
MADIAPLGFAIDTGPLLKAQEAAEAVAESLKGVGTAAGQAQQATSGMAQGASSDAQKLNQTAQAAEALAKANERVAESAAKAQQAQTMLATAPKPTPAAATPGAVSPVNIPSAPMPVQAKSGGWYADQAMADWADGQVARRASASAAEQAALQAAAVRQNPVAAIGAGVTGNAVAGAITGAAGNSQGRGGITDALDDTTQAAGAASTAVGRAASGMNLLSIVGRSAGAALGVGLVMVLKATAEAAIKAADDAELLERRLVSITGSSAAAAEAIEGVSRAARFSGSERGDQRALRVGLERAPLDSSAQDMDTFGSTLALIDQIGGARAADFEQLGNKVASAFKDGRVELGELNTLLDQSPELASRLADGLNLPIEAIKQMAADGNLFSDDFIAAINRTSEQVRKDIGDMEQTSEAAFTNMGRAAGDFFDSLAEESGLNKFSAAISNAIAKGFDDAKRGIEARGLEYLLLRTAPGGMGDQYNDLVQRSIDQEEQDRANGGPRGLRGGLPIAGGRMPGPEGRPGAARPGNRVHTGYDYAAPVGTPLRALANGVVTDFNSDPFNRTPGGNALTVRYEDGSTDYYAHLQNIEGDNWRRGQEFRAGEMLARTGNSGNSTTGPHLHITSRDSQGRLLDPVTRRPVDSQGRPLPDAPATPASDPNTSGMVQRGQALLTSGSSAQIADIDADIRDVESLPDGTPRKAERLAELRDRRRAAVAAQESLSRTPYTRMQDSAQDALRGREIGGGGGGTAIGTAAARAFRAFDEAGYTGATEQDFVNIGVAGAVAQTQGSIETLGQQATAEEGRTVAAGRGRLAMDNARIAEQTAQFRFQNFGTIQDDKITEATEKYRQALERLIVAQRATANAQSLLNAQNEAGVEAAASAALVSGQRGYAVDLARQRAEEAVLASDGGDVTGARIRFNSRNAAREAAANAESVDAMGAAGRYASIGSDAFSRRQFGRMEEGRQAAEGSSNPMLAIARVVADQANEDARITKDRRDADAESVRVAERQLELRGLVGRARREEAAVIQREEELVRDGLLPAGAKLAEEEERSVRANSERLRLIQQQAQSMEEIASIAANTADAVGGGARSLFADLFEDGKVEAEKFVSVIQGVVSRIGTNIADVLLVRPLERATEQFAEQATDFLQNTVGGMRGDRASARGGGAGAVIAEATRDAAATAARSTADARAAVATTAATGAMTTLTRSAMAASAALAQVGGGDTLTKVAATAVGTIVKGAAFGDTFGGVGASPVLFPMAGGMGLAFEAGPEAVLPLKRGPDGRLGVGGSGDGGGVQITVIDQRSGAAAPVETSESKGPDGRRMISMLIRDETRSALREGDMDGPMRDTYGLSRQIARR